MKCIYLILLHTLLFHLTQAQSSKLDWAKNLGGTNATECKSLMVCSNNSLVTVGSFKGTTDFDPGVNTYNLTAVKYSSNIFISKLNAAGDFVWAKSIEAEAIQDAKMDASGNIFILGTYKGTMDFDPGIGIFNLVSEKEDDIFLVKLDSNGNFVWAKSYGGKGYDLGQSIYLKNEAIYISGMVEDTVQFDPLIPSSKFNRIGLNAFVIKLDENEEYDWGYCVKLLKGYGSLPSDIEVDNKNNVLLSGKFKGILNFDSFDISKIDTSFEYDIFIVKLSEHGAFKKRIILSSEETVTESHSGKFDYSFATITDSLDNIYVFGVNVQEMDADPGLGTYMLKPYSIHFIKLDSNFNFKWAKRLNSLYDTPNPHFYKSGIAINKNQNVYITGFFKNTIELKDASPIENLNSNGGYDIFILELNPNGDFINAVKIGNEKDEFGISLVIDSSGAIVIAGTFVGTTNFDPQWGYVSNLSSVSSTYYDTYVAKYENFPTSIKSQANIFYGYRLYPNPNSGIFSLELADKKIDKIEVYNLMGTLVYENKKLSEVNEIDISEHAAGFYFVKVFADNQLLFIEKVLKK